MIVLPEQSTKALEFDSANVDGEGTRSAKNAVFEVSNTGSTSDFEVVAAASLKAKNDKQRFTVSMALTGRCVKLTIKNNHRTCSCIDTARDWCALRYSGEPPPPETPQPSESLLPPESFDDKPLLLLDESLLLHESLQLAPRLPGWRGTAGIRAVPI